MDEQPAAKRQKKEDPQTEEQSQPAENPSVLMPPPSIIPNWTKMKEGTIQQFPTSNNNSLNLEDEKGDDVVFGRLTVLGYSSYNYESKDKIKPQGKQNTQFILKMRKQANGIKVMEERLLSVSSAQPNVPAMYKTIGSTHSMSFCFGNAQRGFIEYAPDADTDIFQFGRASHVNDWVIPGLSSSKGPTMSRYSFRIQCDRKPPYNCRIYAGGFDEFNQLFLGEGAITWSDTIKDGMITNGVRILLNGDTDWCEVSCRGDVFSLRPAFQMRGKRLKTHTNVLADNTLIDIGGIVLLFQTGHGLLSKRNWSLDSLQKELNAKRVQCPVGLHTIDFANMTLGPATSGQTTQAATSPWVFPRCGHVHGFNSQLVIQKRCPLCREESPYMELKTEPQEIMQIFCKDKPTHVFNPCGHMIDYPGALFWGSLKVPAVYDSVYERPNCIVCPFCRVSLSKDRPFSKLIFQAELETEEESSITPTVDVTPFVQEWLESRRQQQLNHQNSLNNNDNHTTNNNGHNNNNSQNSLYIPETMNNGEENSTQANVNSQSDTVIAHKYDVNFG